MRGMRRVAIALARQKRERQSKQMLARSSRPMNPKLTEAILSRYNPQ